MSSKCATLALPADHSGSSWLQVPESRVRIGLLAIALLLGLCRAWAGRHSMNPDGVSYIDLADIYLRGDWRGAVNPYWNPLYVWILSFALRVVQPLPHHEFPAVHGLNLLVYVFSLWCFDCFLREFIRHHQRTFEGRSAGLLAIPRSVWYAVGYSAFLLSSLEWIGIDTVSPDLCVAGLLFLAAALVLRMQAGTTSSAADFLLGMCLGAAYLAKVATALPAILVWTVASVAHARDLRARAFQLLALGGGIGCIAGPYVVVLSQQQGRFTISEAGRLNYAWYVNAIPNHWQGGPAGFGVPIHPHPKLQDNPPVFAFPETAVGTYTGWLNPAYWYKGIKPQFDLRRQIYTFVSNSERLFGFFFRTAAVAFLVLAFALILLSNSWRCTLRTFVALWFLILPAVLAFFMYAAVWVETRFFGAYFSLLCLAAVSCASVPDTTEMRKAVGGITWAAVIVTLTLLIQSTVSAMYQRGREPSQHAGIAEALGRMGILEGDRVAVIGYVNRCGWARLARVRITAEIPHGAEAEFLGASDLTKAETLRILFGTGVKAVIADHRQVSGCPSGWKRIASTDYHVCRAM